MLVKLKAEICIDLEEKQIDKENLKRYILNELILADDKNLKVQLIEDYELQENDPPVIKFS